MEKIHWRDEFSVGVKELDDQHKKLITMINALIAEESSLTDPETIANLLTRMNDYALEHFRAEEYLMAEYGFHRKKQQEKQHRAFIAKTASFCSSSDIGPNILSVALLEYLSTWLIDHILTEDMQYKKFFAEKGVR